MANKYTVTIEDAPSGTWTKVKAILADVDWDYEKPEFSFPADDALLDRVLSVEGVELIVGKAEPEPAPEVKPKKKTASAWTVVAGDSVFTVRCDECPPAKLLAHRAGASSCSIEDVFSKVVARWP